MKIIAQPRLVGFVNYHQWEGRALLAGGQADRSLDPKMSLKPDLDILNSTKQKPKGAFLHERGRRSHAQAGLSAHEPFIKPRLTSLRFLKYSLKRDILREKEAEHNSLEVCCKKFARNLDNLVYLDSHGEVI